MRVATLLFAIMAALPATAQPADESQSRPPVSKSDVLIVQRARQLLNSPEKWNRADNRNCPATETKFSLYCALERATYLVTQDFAHRGATMQESRFVIDEDLAPNNHYDHRLMDYNNDPHTTFADVQRFFDILQGRIEGRLAEQKGTGGQLAVKSMPMPTRTASPGQVTQNDIDLIRKVQAILDSPAKWDRASSFTCAPNATKFGLYCAFEAASVAVTGKPDYEGPAIDEVRQLISNTAPNASHYNGRLIDYNNDPTISFADMQKLLQAAETNLENRLSHPK